MTASNVHTFTLTRNEIITEALELTATIDIGSPVPPEVMESCARSLNLYAKSWQTKGLFLHTYKPATLFLTTGQQSYLLGPTGDHATESYVETTLTADAAALDTVLAVTSETGINVADKIGIILSDNSIHWDTVASLAPLTLTTGIVGASVNGNSVYTYTTKIIRPIKITDVLHVTDNVEQPITKISLSEYKELTNKDTESQPVQYAYDPQLDDSRLYVWPVADNGKQRINFTYQKPVDDFTTDSDTATMPTDWLQCFTIGLAWTIAPKRLVPLSEQQALKLRYEEALRDLDDFEESSVFFQPARRR